MQPAYRYFPDLNAELNDIPADSIVSRTLHSDARLKVILFGFAAGQELSEHTAARPAILHFLRGVATVTLGDETFTAKAGSFATMPARLPHSIVAQTEVVMLLLLLAPEGKPGEGA
jgi:quercetin dioxygenase-like cupin family protein